MAKMSDPATIEIEANNIHHPAIGLFKFLNTSSRRKDGFDMTFPCSRSALIRDSNLHLSGPSPGDGNGQMATFPDPATMEIESNSIHHPAIGLFKYLATANRRKDGFDMTFPCSRSALIRDSNLHLSGPSPGDGDGPMATFPDPATMEIESTTIHHPAIGLFKFLTTANRRKDGFDMG
ncbi:MAG TPA: hypothetical protein VFM80_08830 [Gracilimonas sp.]|uniref:hypothetical protein n=1 Tax=Gracilimonas sp. TaxID=1974203 RepID=UPI002DAB6FD3|nr:hypothetical protein [Gracilimonas sp.]